MSGTGTTRLGRLPGGRPVFTKTLADAPERFFDREATGLRALADAGARVPEVLEVTDDRIVLSVVDASGSQSSATEEAFGRELAALHQVTSPTFGAVDGEPIGYLGACPIDLTSTETWAESWLERRVVPLTRQAVERGLLPASALRTAEQIDADDLGPAEPPALLHGDLWAGNRLIDAAGRSWLIDPCAQYGHREVDLAMMRLFGGFGRRAFESYAEVLPLADGAAQRVNVYQGVPLLVHTLLFGAGYAHQTLAALEAVRGR